MCEHGCRASHNEGHDDSNIRPRQLRSREVPWEGSYGSKLMSRRTERPYKVDGAGELARHSAARCSAPEINGPVVQQEFTFLLRETCSPSPSATAGAAASNDRRAGTGVSRGHSSEVGPSRRPELVSRGSTASALPETTKPSGRVSVQRLLQLEHGTPSEDLLERILSPENLQAAWRRVVSACEEARTNLPPVLPGKGRELGDGHPIDPSGPAIGLHPEPCLLQVSWAEDSFH